MIFDQENIFFDAVKDVSESNIIANVGGGDAADPLFLAVVSDTEEAEALTFKLETSDDEEFTGSTELASFTSEAGAKGLIIGAKVPYGAKAFLKLTCEDSPIGAITAGLVENVPNWRYPDAV